MRLIDTKKLKNKFLSANDVQKILLGRMLAHQNENRASVNKLADVEFQVFSQWGDDGIIQYLTSKLEIENKVFVEFGVETYHESNTRFLLMKDNWSGLVIDGSDDNINTIKKQDIFWRHSIEAISSFITTENINSLITSAGITGEIGILSVDIDGNDYWVTKVIDSVNPVILINEYNSAFGDERELSVPYDPAFVRSKAHHSNLYYGVSLPAIVALANEKGYHFIGCNQNGNNAYFIRKDKLGNLFKPLTAKEGFVDAKFREARNAKGELLFVGGKERYNILKGMPIFDTKLNQLAVL